MRKFILILISVSFLLTTGNAQVWKEKRMEIYIGPGVVSEGLKKGEAKGISLIRNGFNINAGIRYRLNDDFSGRINLAYGHFRSIASMVPHGIQLYYVGTTFIEPSVIGEYHLFKNTGDNSYLLSSGRRNPSRKSFSRTGLNLFAGVGVITGKTNESHDLHLIIPAGVSIINSLSSGFQVGIELGGRYVSGDFPEGARFYSPDHMFWFLNFDFSFKISLNKNP
jgi:hypothetical protein